MELFLVERSAWRELLCVGSLSDFRPKGGAPAGNPVFCAERHCEEVKFQKNLADAAIQTYRKGWIASSLRFPQGRLYDQAISRTSSSWCCSCRT
jgi:hypothetical protein